MEDLSRKKYNRLKETIEDRGSAAVAYSGGVDSSFLLKVCYEVLKDKTIGIYCDSVLQPAQEKESAISLAEDIGVKLIILKGVDLNHKAFREHPENRCYFCKGLIFDRILKTANDEGFTHVFDGSNFDDLKDYRPGKKALSERGIHSPLQEAELTKSEIRLFSKELGLPSWDKDALACLATRIPYHEAVTPEKLQLIDHIETLLVRNGFRNVRARLIKTAVRIEVNSSQISELRKKLEELSIREFLANTKYKQLDIDPKGYQQGSMNNNILS